jgi:hypothetical protein
VDHRGNSVHHEPMSMEGHRARPVGAPELKGTGQGGETGSGNLLRASTEGEQRRGGRATWWWSGSSVGARSSAGDEERRAGEGLVRCRVLRGSSGRLL